MKKNLKWIVLTVALVLVASVAVLMLFSGEPDTEPDVQTQPTTQPVPEATQNDDQNVTPKIYWNVEREIYFDTEDKQTTRVRSDGLYRIRFAVDGEQIDLFAPDLETAQAVDDLYFMGLEVGEDNIIKRVVPVEEFTGGTALLTYYIQDFDEDSVSCNMSITYNGPHITLPYDSNTQFINVTGTGITVGMPSQLKIGGGISGVLSPEGVLTHVFVEDPFEKSPVYWNVTRMYDSANKMTTRESDLLGNYVYTFAVDGELVELKTKDIKIASNIDSYAAKCMHLEFDEEGYITKASHPRNATGGTSVASWHHIMEMRTDGFVAEKFSGSDKGNVETISLSSDCKIFDVSGTGAYIGEPTTLRMYDQVHCLKDVTKRVCVVFVVGRFMDGEHYWNVERQYDSAAKSTKRSPDADGWYHMLFAYKGKQVTLRTQDKATVDYIDSRAAKVCALQVDGDVIVKAAAPNKIPNGTTFASWCDITALDGNVITALKSGSDAPEVGEMAPNCEIYDVSDTATMVGETTTLRVGDRIHGLKGLDGKVYKVYVVSHPIHVPIFWNVERQYDSTNKTTKRVPDADGYYHITMASNGKQVELRTKDKSLMTKIDAVATRVMGLQVYNGIITKFYNAKDVQGYGGGSKAGWCDIIAIDGSKVTLKKNIKSDKDYGSVYTLYIGSWVPVYNGSTNNKYFVGEETTLQVGDRIHSLIDSDKSVRLVYVVERPFDWDIYWNKERCYDSETASTTRTPDAEGWYYLEMAVNGTQVTMKCQDKAVVDYIDARAAMCSALNVDGDVILEAKVPAAMKRHTGPTFASWSRVTSVEGNVVNSFKGKETYTGTMTEDCKIYNVSNIGTFGEPTDLREGDLIHGLSNADGGVNMIFVISRAAEKSLFWNVDRQYDSTNKVTKRTPDADGWYTIVMAVDGQQRTLRTKNKDLMTQIDAVATRTVGLNLEGDEIFEVVKNSDVVGYTGGSYAGWCDIIAIDGNTYTLIKNLSTDKDYGTVYTLVIEDDCPVYDCSEGYKEFCGEPSSLKLGDRLYCFKDENGKISIALIISHASDMEMYWNMDQLYDSKAGSTTRTPDADGWYSLRMAHNGQEVTVKTKDKATVDYIDARAARCVALRVEDGVILKHAMPNNVMKAAGSTFASWATVTQVTEDGFTAKKGSTVYNGEFGPDVEIYDVSDDTSPAGAVTQLKVGDLIHSLSYADGRVSFVFVIERAHYAYCEVCKEEVAWNSWDGESSLTDGHWYLEQDITLNQKTNIEEDAHVTLWLNGHGITGSSSISRMFEIFGTLDVLDTKVDGEFKGHITSTKNNASLAPVFYVKEGGTFNLYGGNITATKPAQEVGIGVVYKAEMNMYDGVIYGGEMTVTSGNKGGGNIAVFTSATFNMYGGVIRDGKAARFGGNVFCNVSSASFNMYGGTVTGGTVTGDGIGGGVYSNANVTLGGNATITGNEGGNLVLAGTLVNIDSDLGEKAISVTQTSGSVFTGVVAEGAEKWFVSDGNDAVIRNAEGKLEFAHRHCVCNGTGDHTCEDVTWEPWTGTWESGKYYYLTKDTTTSAVIRPEAGQTLNLCLNGYDLTGGDILRVFNIYGTLNLCDHKTESGYEGTVTGTRTTTKMAPTFYVQPGGVFNFYGGNLTASASSPRGGVGIVQATMNMYDGKIYGGVCSDSTAVGGNVEVISSGIFTMYDGEISGGSGAGYGGNIGAKDVSSTLKLLGGTVTGGSAVYGGGVYCRSTLQLGGDIRICDNTGSDLYLTDRTKVTVVEPLTGENVIGITLENGIGVFTEVVDEQNVKAFFSNAGKKLLHNAEGKLELEEE